MTMIPFRDVKGGPWARVTCDSCGSVLEIRCEHAKAKGAACHGRLRLEEGRAVRKLNEMGWAASTRKQTCPDCQNKDKIKPKEEPEMATVPMTQIPVGGVKLDPHDVPKPTLAQRREIMLMLEEVYDVDAKRYKGEETDKSVAHALGIERWGWIAEVREGFFGPAGNEAADLLAAEVREKLKAADRVIQTAEDQIRVTGKALTEAKALRDDLAALLARVKGAK